MIEVQMYSFLSTYPVSEQTKITKSVLSSLYEELPKGVSVREESISLHISPVVDYFSTNVGVLTLWVSGDITPETLLKLGTLKHRLENKSIYVSEVLIFVKQRKEV